jgi:D-lyxose ketol-isomerase
MESQAQETAFIIPGHYLNHPVPDIQKRLALHSAIGLYDLDKAGLFDEKHPSRSISGAEERHGRRETLGHGLKLHPGHHGHGITGSRGRRHHNLALHGRVRSTVVFVSASF